MSRSRSSRSLRAALCAAPLVVGSLLALACSAPPGSPGTIGLVGPAYDQFVGGDSNGAGVHVFLENQCGTLDCHGQIGRPLRLYSVNGLRAPNDAGLVPGAGAETTAELYANYLAAIGVQPEVMDSVVEGKAPPTALLLVTKPMGLERHK